jgi:hypothetical protein
VTPSPKSRRAGRCAGPRTSTGESNSCSVWLTRGSCGLKLGCRTSSGGHRPLLGKTTLRRRRTSRVGLRTGDTTYLRRSRVCGGPHSAQPRQRVGVLHGLISALGPLEVRRAASRPRRTQTAFGPSRSPAARERDSSARHTRPVYGERPPAAAAAFRTTAFATPQSARPTRCSRRAPGVPRGNDEVDACVSSARCQRREHSPERTCVGSARRCRLGGQALDDLFRIVAEAGRGSRAAADRPQEPVGERRSAAVELLRNSGACCAPSTA